MTLSTFYQEQAKKADPSIYELKYNFEFVTLFFYKNAYQFVTGNAVNDHTVAILVIELEKGRDECSNFLKSQLELFFKDKAKGKYFDLTIEDLKAIKELFWELEGSHIWDYVDEHIDFLNKSQLQPYT